MVLRARSVPEPVTGHRDLSSEDAHTVAAAIAARKAAYAPYSRFRVGAAVRTREGTIHRGCNVENAAFPEGVAPKRRH